MAPQDTPAPLDELCRLALDTADAAAEMVRTRRSGGFDIDTKSTGTDLVTDIDVAADRLIMDRIGDARADDGFITEEHAADAGTSGVTWVIDPIDGTTNFVYGLAPHLVSIGARTDDGTPLVGVIVEISSGTAYTATIGGGAFRDGAPISVRPAPPLAEALVSTGFGYSIDRRTAQAEVLARVIGSVRDVRRRGAAAADLCSVAEGTTDAYWEVGLNEWDRAAGTLIATEAGAACEAIGGGPVDDHSLVTAHPALIGELQRLLVDAGATNV